MSTQPPGHIIVGAGLAGAKAAQSLRREGHTGPITLIGSEPHRPYNRPPLSKEYLGGTAERAALEVLPATWYQDHDVELRLSTTVSELDLPGHRITLSGGEELPYEKLLLATGSRARRLDLPGTDLDGVFRLRDVADSDAIRGALDTASHVAIIGGGWVGLEIASAARQRGVAVTLLEADRLPLLRVLGAEVAQHFADLHTSHGVDLRCGVQVVGFTGDGIRVTGVELADGTHVVADAVIVGIGALPNTGVAERAGLAVDNGILVDASLRSSDPDVYAAGDVANAWHPLLGVRLRVEHWSNAAWQSRVAAQSMLGRDATYDRLPYFYSDQYDVSLEYTGHVGAAGHDQVVHRGSPESGGWIAFWLRGGRLLAGMNVNTPRAVRDITALLRSGRRFSAEQLADTTDPLSALLAT